MDSIRPALDALTPRLVERQDLRAVAALGSLRFSMSSIVGPALGGLLIWKLGMASTYAIDVVSFVVSLIALASIRSMPEKEKSKRVWEALRKACDMPSAGRN